MSDSRYSAAHRHGRNLDRRLVSDSWRKDRLPVIGIDVPSYELPLPEGVGEDKLQQEHMSLREIEETWKEKLYEKNHTPGSK